MRDVRTRASKGGHRRPVKKCDQEPSTGERKTNQGYEMEDATGIQGNLHDFIPLQLTSRVDETNGTCNIW